MNKNVLAHYGGEKTITKQFPWPIFSDDELNGVKSVIESREWGVSASEDSAVAVFEERLC